MWCPRTRIFSRILATLLTSGLAAAPALAEGIFSRGTAVLDNLMSVDLDLGSVSNSLPGYDIIFVKAPAELRSSGQTRFSAANNAEWTRDDCERNATRVEAVALAQVPGGSWVCYRTGAGRFGQMRLSTVPVIGDNVGNLKVEFATWKDR